MPTTPAVPSGPGTLTAPPGWTVAFRGARGGTWPATAVQTGVLQWAPHDLHGSVITQHVGLPPGATRAQVEDAVRVAVTRHEALRTMFRRSPDGRAEQVVAAGGSLTVAVAHDPHSPAADARALLLQRLADDPEGTLPVQFVVLLDGDRPVRLELALWHTAGDTMAGALVLREIAGRFADPPVPLPPVPSWGPVEQALAEQGPEWLARQEETLHHWDGVLARAPFCVLPPHRHDRPGRHWTGQLVSASAGDGLAALAARAGTGRSAALVAALLRALGAWLDQPDLLVHCTCANRNRRELLRYVGVLAQEAVLHHRLDGAGDGGTFDDELRRLGPALARAYAHAHTDPLRLGERIARAEQARGAARHRDVVINDLSPGAFLRAQDLGLSTRDDPAPPVGPQEREALHVVPGPSWPDPVLVLVRRTGPRVHLVVAVDDRIAPPEDVAALLTGLRALLVAAGRAPLRPDAVREALALRPVPHAAVLPARRGRIDAAAVAVAVQEATGSPLVRVLAGPDGDAVCCLVAPPGRAVDERRLRDVLRAESARRHAVRVPDRFVVAARAPEDPDDLHLWTS